MLAADSGIGLLEFDEQPTAFQFRQTYAGVLAPMMLVTSALRRALTRMPPRSVNFTALETRFRMIWRTRL